MGEISIVHGIIKVEDLDLYEKTVESMEIDENYPWIRPEMLNLCGDERPYYYESPIATFGATYKNLVGGTSWSEFILKFEYFLSKIKFDFARIRLETEFMGDYEFFWGGKRGVDNEFYAGKDLIEQDRWYFGYGVRNMFGGLNEQEPKLPFDFQYPIEFDSKILEEFSFILPELNQLELKTKTFFENETRAKVLGNGNFHLILTYLKINKIIRFGWESEKGLFIERLKEIKMPDKKLKLH
ncbi:hypothetical protein [Chondrinema litorale]|uniref:hypothetical protein n=1 Tax=Chondrinema litorale TaxID=2994555 RepID=UPI002542F153|nr:hypothetical protein [Chondrinema litorale]UZR96782.1 hypothetical protein OQ292_24080 [Chondrinema litorale]